MSELPRDQEADSAGRLASRLYYNNPRVPATKYAAAKNSTRIPAESVHSAKTEDTKTDVTVGQPPASHSFHILPTSEASLKLHPEDVTTPLLDPEDNQVPVVTPHLVDQISSIVAKTVRETFGAYMREQATRDKEKAEHFRTELHAEIAAAQARTEIALTNQMNQKLKKYATVQDVNLIRQIIQTTRRPTEKESNTPEEPPRQQWDRSQRVSPFLDNAAVNTQEYLGPPAHGLLEIVPSDRRFADVLNYRRYRLMDTTAEPNPEITRNYGRWARRIRHRMERCRFDGSKPVAILNFLRTYKQTLDSDRIPEVAALEIMGNFLDHDANTLYCLMMNNSADNLGGFQTWPQAVQFLLQTYANDRELETAVEALENMKMSNTDSVTSFYRRLTAAGRDLAGAYSQDDLMSRFCKGLPQHLREQMRFHKPNYKGAGAFLRLVNHAEALHNSYLSLPTRRGTIPINLIPDHQSADDRSTSSSSSEDRQAECRSVPKQVRFSNVAALQSQLPPTPLSHDSSIEYSDYMREQIAAPVHAIRNHQYSPRYTEASPQNRPHTPPGPSHENLLPMTCFRCYRTGHSSPRCPDKEIYELDEAYKRLQVKNYNKLEEWQKVWLKSIDRQPPLLHPSTRTRRPRRNTPESTISIPSQSSSPNQKN